MLKKVLTFASIVEVATGLALLIAPRFVVGLLVGPNVPDQDIPMGRLPGIAILALGLACWPGWTHAQSGSSAARGMLVYNLLTALFLVYMFRIGHLGGVLLWPAVVLHAVLTFLLAGAWRAAHQEGSRQARSP